MKLRTERYNNALFHFFTRNSPNSGPIARPEPPKLSCGAGNVDSIWSAYGQQEIQGTE